MNLTCLSLRIYFVFTKDQFILLWTKLTDDRFCRTLRPRVMSLLVQSTIFSTRLSPSDHCPKSIQQNPRVDSTNDCRMSNYSNYSSADTRAHTQANGRRPRGSCADQRCKYITRQFLWSRLHKREGGPPTPFKGVTILTSQGSFEFGLTLSFGLLYDLRKGA